MDLDLNSLLKLINIGYISSAVYLRNNKLIKYLDENDYKVAY